MSRLLYRIEQFWLGLLARPLTPSQATDVQPFLSPVEWRLFQEFTPNDQQHSYRVWRMLQNAGHDKPELLTAALLHDIGKIRMELSLIHRSIVVLSLVFAQSKAKLWAEIPWEEAAWWQRPIIVGAKHPEWGADLIAQNGGDPLVVSLIRRHQTKIRETMCEEDALLITLQWADDQC